MKLTAFRRWLITLVVVGGMFPGYVAAQSYPTKSIRMIVPFTPGGGTDQTARLLAQIVTEALKVPVVVENRPGASGMIGADAVAKSAPDGYTILVSSSQELTINHHVLKTPYDPAKDFMPVTLAVNSPLVLVANAASSMRTLGDFLTAARAKPGSLTFASSSSGSPGHLAGELLNVKEKVDILHIPYKGAAPALTDLLGGQVSMAYLGLAVVLPHIRSGKLRALAVTTRSRAAALPETPTMIEAGVPDYVVDNWFGVVVPAGTPAEIVEKLNATMARGLRQPDVREKLAAQGAEPVGNTAAEFQRFLREESEKYQRVARESGLKVE